ncbi:MAG: hypothetical protein A2729_01120 [Candidatus Buchananbacteria bacterium RIFCSPHIGHO2_01_FULL_39_14]|uniref:DNA ligase D 3'-phosphoesterase domain-containing protein n=2 Tax=Candidatus Buchananiibacteriota TaxID=1817903 RepID=A0A1G1YWG4_9BACT|nr:MAG: hypothetical protein A2729_01120 [Candidatus Buchananbacteria bacterium RIFCSPHIGHO2_01_FULL_39_14]OGY49177.1 MAG: hypothetical protein A3D39_05720 [Candidatus Buchananbacteria bacterium RIFCSPHIGHO2_02_FULL_39_17]OGY55910.1 MAG: hypothetical protein A2912_02900 [Candidatus Buchananbacteria bacterium RIFCSPLOWO2_01_FULL_40_23b]
MALEIYKKKRHFAKTPEPKGEIKVKGLNRFVVQKHQASHLHYDFRLELPENIIQSPARLPKPERRRQVVLKSWAVPKGVPPVAGKKSLAVAVEDHPVSYINFSGVIPQGNYGAGKVEIWDKGKFKLLAQAARSLKFELQGKKLKGKYVLFQLKGKNWLIFKMK